MTISVESSSPASLNKGSSSLMGSSPIYSPSSDKRFWSTLRSRIDTLLENRPLIDFPLPAQKSDGAAEDKSKRMKEDAMLLLRGFDSVSYTLSELSNNLENALQGARDLAKPPTLTDILHYTMEKAKSGENQSKEGKDEGDEQKKKGEESNKGLKRKLDDCSEDSQQDDDTKKENGQVTKELGKFKKAKNLAISMASKAATLARELKSIRSDLRFMQERSALLEEENRRLRDGFDKGIPPEEDDLVRLQMEALLTEKSRLANENANLNRENQCLRHLVEYHQLTSQDLSASYEDLLRGMGLDISPEEDTETNGGSGARQKDIYGISKSLDEIYDEE
ncbi:PREDICTED: uncharacterized protein LOC109205174 [Nicotiana attenuata]|uniref:Uncharacterized protein n=1 Tax=Nicotiana attenuata TaxID=49451 RepID=A0A314KX42_NICAT|nr:PREDICTED: uncharacterized protein LOC109205174 [Nicotiana attenuata]OIT34081.1 hypothetical protein A4A49_09640 [Nicotiana attenuata]